jgi:hypothetical protein
VRHARTGSRQTRLVGHVKTSRSNADFPNGGFRGLRIDGPRRRSDRRWAAQLACCGLDRAKRELGTKVDPVRFGAARFIVAAVPVGFAVVQPDALGVDALDALDALDV